MGSSAMRVRLRCSSWSQLLALHRRDLSRGQLFLRSKNAPPPGTRLVVVLYLPSGSTIELTGVVSVVVGENNARGAGAVVNLDPLAPAHKMTLEAALRALSEHTRRATARRPAVAAPKPPPPSGDADTLSFEKGRELACAEDDLRVALRTELSTLAKLNPFQILGVGYEADDDAVRHAFGELSRRYHPDRFVRYQSSEITRLAEELFVRAREAYKRTATAQARALLIEQIKRNRKPPPIPRPELVKVARRGRATKATAKHRAHNSGGGLVIEPDTAAVAPTQTPSGTERQIVPPTAMANQAAATRHIGREKVQPKGERKAQAPALELDPLVAFPDARNMIAEKRFTDAAGLFTGAVRRDAKNEAARAGLELAEGLRALEAGDRLEAAQRFEAVLDLHPANEVAARELAKMRRRATNQRQGLLAKLMKDQG